VLLIPKVIAHMSIVHPHICEAGCSPCVPTIFLLSTRRPLSRKNDK
jgi:hypothetical protein